MITFARIAAATATVASACAARPPVDTKVRASTLDPATACATVSGAQRRELYFGSGQLAARVTCRDGVLDGYSAAYHPSGTRRAIGTYRDGRRTGAWREWHANGQLWTAGSYADDRETGRWVEYHATGDLKFEGTYVNGLLDGTWTSHCETGGVHARGQSVAGKLEGAVTVSGCRTEDRTEQVFVRNRPHGIWRFFKGEKRTHDISYKDGVFDGEMKGYDDDGAVKWTVRLENGLAVEDEDNDDDE